MRRGLDTNMTAQSLIYLITCALENKVPDLIREKDLPSVYASAAKHKVEVLVACALKAKGVENKKYMFEWNMRRILLFENEWSGIKAELEKHNIWYMPLKGMLLRNYYPSPAMREFADYDILFDESRAEDVRRIMVEGSGVLHTYLFQAGICQDSWNNLFKAELFRDLRYPEGRSFEDYAIKPHLLQKAKKMAYTPACLLHYRNRQNSLSNLHTLKSNVDYWLAYRERFDLLSLISDEYYRLSLAQAIGAIGRMWRWVAAYTGEEKQQASVWLDEMQEFNNLHFKEIIRDPAYSRNTKMIALCVRSRSPLLLSALYWATRIYRNCSKDNGEFFP